MLFRKAQDLRTSGQIDPALDELLKLQATLRSKPELNTLALNVEREMAEAYLSRSGPSKDDLARAVACLETVAAGQPRDGFVHYKLGIAYRQMGDERRASANLQEAIQSGVRNLAAHVNLVEAAFGSNQSALGLQAAKDVISPSLRSPDVLLRLGRLLFGRLFYKEALTAFQLAHEIEPRAFEPRFRLALTHYLLQEFADTVAVLQPEDVQSSAEAASLNASAEAQLGHSDIAISLLQRAILHFPQSPHAYINLALIQMDLGSAADAKKSLERLQSLPAQQDAKVFYAVKRNSCRDLAKPGENENPPAQSASRQSDYYFQLAAQLLERFHYGSALEVVRLSEAEEGPSARVLYVEGDSCLNLDPQGNEPIQFLKEAITRNPNFDKAYYLLGRAYARQGDIAEARTAYRTAAALHPDPSYFLSLGKTLAKSGDLTGAISAYGQALKLDPSYAEAHLEMGRTSVQMEDFAKAKQELEKAIDLEPDFYEADYLLGRLLFRQGDKDASARYMAAFEQKKSALMEQSVIGSGFIFGGE
jgi:tetratricopeptide (TPR) repeat protein